MRLDCRDGNYAGITVTAILIPYSCDLSRTAARVSYLLPQPPPIVDHANTRRPLLRPGEGLGGRVDLVVVAACPPLPLLGQISGHRRGWFRQTDDGRARCSAWPQ